MFLRSRDYDSSEEQQPSLESSSRASSSFSQEIDISIRDNVSPASKTPFYETHRQRLQQRIVIIQESEFGEGSVPDTPTFVNTASQSCQNICSQQHKKITKIQHLKPSTQQYPPCLHRHKSQQLIRNQFKPIGGQISWSFYKDIFENYRFENKQLETQLFMKQRTIAHLQQNNMIASTQTLPKQGRFKFSKETVRQPRQSSRKKPSKLRNTSTSLQQKRNQGAKTSRNCNHGVANSCSSPNFRFDMLAGKYNCQQEDSTSARTSINDRVVSSFKLSSELRRSNNQIERLEQIIRGLKKENDNYSNFMKSFQEVLVKRAAKTKGRKEGVKQKEAAGSLLKQWKKMSARVLKSQEVLLLPSKT